VIIDICLIISRIIVSGVFLLAGISKIRMPFSQLFNSVMGYDLLPEGLAKILAKGLPWLEVTVGGLFLFGAGRHITSIIGIGLLLIFSSAVIISLVRGKNNDCGCFGSLTPVQWRLIYRNLGLMGLLVFLYAMRSDRLSIDFLFNKQQSYQLPILGITILASIWIFIIFISLLLHYLTRQNSSVSKANS